MLWLPAGVFVSQPAEKTDVQTAGEPTRKTRGTNQLNWKETTNTDAGRNTNS